MRGCQGMTAIEWDYRHNRFSDFQGEKEQLRSRTRLRRHPLFRTPTSPRPRSRPTSPSLSPSTSPFPSPSTYPVYVNAPCPSPSTCPVYVHAPRPSPSHVSLPLLLVILTPRAPPPRRNQSNICEETAVVNYNVGGYRGASWCSSAGPAGRTWCAWAGASGPRCRPCWTPGTWVALRTAPPAWCPATRRPSARCSSGSSRSLANNGNISSYLLSWYASALQKRGKDTDRLERKLSRYLTFSLPRSKITFSQPP